MTSNRIDLSSLPFPSVLEELDYEAELEECKKELIKRDPELTEALDFESEPLVKLLETFAYRLLLKTGQINSKAKALMLAYAKGSDLDHLAANRGVYRLTIHPAQPNANPPIDAVMESDEDLRRRTHLQPESMSAGSEGCYQFWGLSAHGHIKDISVKTPQEGHVNVWVQSHIEDTADPSLLETVNTALNPGTRRPLTDYVHFKAATPKEWELNATLVLFPGPDSSVVKAAAQADAQKYADLTSSLGYDITRSGLFHALHQGGVQNVLLSSPAQDIILSKSQYGKCTAINIEIVEFRDV